MSELIEEIKKCRICGNHDLAPVVDLGLMAPTGIFQKFPNNLPRSKMRLVKCVEDNGKHCGLLQLADSFTPEYLYGNKYGYRSSLNSSMVGHLAKITSVIEEKYKPLHDELIVDIGSNDGALLRCFDDNYSLLGIDPLGEQFRKYYRKDISLESAFFDAELLPSKAKIITSIAMFYDLPNPLKFMQDIRDSLALDGVWITEQSYMPFMVENCAYDTICHEHFEYYSLRQMKWMADRVGLKIIHIEFNKINGGSFQVHLALKESDYYEEDTMALYKLCKLEELSGYDGVAPYHKFMDRIRYHKNELMRLIEEINFREDLIIGYGASTKGNVLLQYCGITSEMLPYIADVNTDKHGSHTPGTSIEIISEEEAHKKKPDYLMVFPWHFKENILEREKKFLSNGGRMIFPLPNVEVI